MGECAIHAKQCCGDFGAFLSLENGVTLIMFKGIPGIYTAPYLDPYGEEDLKLERGLPMSFNKERYENLRELVASHSISSKTLLNHAMSRNRL